MLTTITDETGSLSVTVPAAWERAVAPAGWEPPNGASQSPALSVGTMPEWTDPQSTAQGVFLGD